MTGIVTNIYKRFDWRIIAEVLSIQLHRKWQIIAHWEVQETDDYNIDTSQEPWNTPG